MVVQRTVHIAGQDELKPAFTRKNIAVLFGCDEYFLPHCLVAIASILENSRRGDCFDFWVFQTGIPEQLLVTAQQWAARWPNARVRFLDIGQVFSSIDAKFITTKTISIATYYRILAPQVFTCYDKMLYLDGDVVALDDIAILFKLDLQDSAAGACHDFVMESASLDNSDVAEYWRTHLQLEAGGPYFNAGVILMNLEVMRRDNLQAAILDKSSCIVDGGLMDQDMLNAALKDKVVYFDPRWNLFDSFLDGDPRTVSVRELHQRYGDQIMDARMHPGIIHYVHHKPWKTDYLGTNAGCYWKYASMTPFYGQLCKQVQKGCGKARIFGRSILWSLQSLHYGLRLRFCEAGKKQVYRDRIYNLTARKKNNLSHMQAMRLLSR